MRSLMVLGLLAVLPAGSQTFKISDLITSQHNLTASGAGPVKSGDTRPCVFCHIPHNGYTITGYLWNQRTSIAAYTAYRSPTENAAPAVPGGTSRLCLSCHDGTVALGNTVAAGTIVMTGTMSGADTTGTDFNRHHPVGIRPVDDGQLYTGLAQTPATSADPAITLPGNVIECITCHEPHKENIDTARGMFLVRSNQNSGMCLACHDPTRPAPSNLNGWTASAHPTATNVVSEMYGTVGGNGCQSCHLPHNPSANAPLLRAAEENACSSCHTGTSTTPALLNVMSEFALAYAHPTTSLSGLHAPGESAYPLNANRHAECPDCHNAHAAQKPGLSPTPPSVPAALIGAGGVDSGTGQTALKPAVNEFEVCFKCHANSTGKPQAAAGYSRYGHTPWRVTDSTAPDPFNTRLEFASLISRHNVTLPRQRTATQVPSLRAAILQLSGAAGRSLAAGNIYCGDCHNNNQARSDAGTGASGVHGSTWPHILERRYDAELPPATPGSSAPGVSYVAGLSGTYALCYKCHDIDNSIMQNRSFTRHNLHVSGARAACSTCHDSHGINGGNTTNNPSLVNFDTTIVGPNSSGILRIERTGSFTGRCYLRCHGQDHNPYSY